MAMKSIGEHEFLKVNIRAFGRCVFGRYVDKGAE
jgi:hypothetical protein